MKKPDRSFSSPGPFRFSGPGEFPFHFHLIQETPIGDLAIAYRAAPFCVYRIFLPFALSEQRKIVTSAPDGSHGTCPQIIRIAQDILDYLHGDIAAPGLPPWDRLHLKGLSPLQVHVLQLTARIPYGRTVSYKAIAEAIGRPRAYRFVGTALAANPFPLLIPCHRVVRSDATPGEYGGGRALKKWLIRLESGLFS